ncbi:MAG: hypothetical protein FWC61_03680, partial [Proteobacteria bacterium]|nr:hypothetical protein [Pseudomonadota bacterium]
MIKTPQKILSANKTDNVWEIATEGGDVLKLYPYQFLKKDVVIRAGYFIVSCTYNCKQYGNWCKSRNLIGRDDIPGIRQGKHFP